MICINLTNCTFYTVPPLIDGQTDEFMQDMDAVVNSTISLRCDVTGNPTPAVSWLKDGLHIDSGPHHQILEDGKLLEVIHKTQVSPFLLIKHNIFDW